ncbi:MAG: imelysin [Moraxellaceae bacterium]|nr:imelysin [Moraxellaceae bacterium]
MKTITLKQGLLATAITASLALTACQKPADKPSDEPKAEENAPATSEQKTKEAEQLIKSYSDIALATYSDALEGAKKLQTAIDKFVTEPTDENLANAKAVYQEVRNPYSQSEVFRFDEGFVGKNEKRAIESVDDWEGQLNAWPLDEALIDYVSKDYEGEYNSKTNIINSDKITIGSESKDTSKITPELLAELNEFGGSEANVTSGYHAIEFLLWGQDTNGTGEGAGKRPVSDYFTEKGKCTNGAEVAEDAKTCTRRGEYLKSAVQLLVTDLENMVAQWQPNSKDTLRADLESRVGKNAVRQIMYQMGSLALGELASERMQVAFVTGSTEDEHECFSDLTHYSYSMNAQGIKNVFEGNYKGKGGYGVKQYLIDMGKKDEADKLQASFDKVTTSFKNIVSEAENNGVKVDQMIATVAQAGKHNVSKEEQEKRRALIQNAITDLQAETIAIEESASAVGIDKLDADGGSAFGTGE